MTSKTSHKKMVKETLEIARKICNDWEAKFLRNMRDWQDEFTPSQAKKIEELYARACASPY